MSGSGGGGITGGRVRNVDLPTARWGARGYDRRAVDDFLLECADAVDLLNNRLREAEQELGRLAGGGLVGRPLRSVGLEMPAIGRGSRASRVRATSRPKRARRRGPASPARTHA
jgi:DivIVA domain-containing protein